MKKLSCDYKTTDMGCYTDLNGICDLSVVLNPIIVGKNFYSEFLLTRCRDEKRMQKLYEAMVKLGGNYECLDEGNITKWDDFDSTKNAIEVIVSTAKKIQ